MKIVGGPSGPSGAARDRLWAMAAFFSISFTTVFAAGTTGAPEVRPAAGLGRASRPIAVVELFTSEACAACPAAEAYFKELLAEARNKRKAVFALAFHVDYWNPPGRRDPLSTDAFAQRQKTYAQAMRLDSVYTPQMIVNGTDEFVGSERERAQQSIAAALARPAELAVTLRVNVADGQPSPVRVQFECSALPAGAVMNVALVERGLSNVVKAGTHSPRRQYENVVRAFRTLPLQKKSGTVELTAPAAIVTANSSVIGYVQDPRTGAVLGAAAFDLQPSAPVRQAMLDSDE